MYQSLSLFLFFSFLPPFPFPSLLPPPPLSPHTHLRTYTEIIGTLRRFIEEDRLPHLLFYGPPGACCCPPVKHADCTIPLDCTIDCTAPHHATSHHIQRLLASCSAEHQGLRLYNTFHSSVRVHTSIRGGDGATYRGPLYTPSHFYFYFLF